MERGTEKSDKVWNIQALDPDSPDLHKKIEELLAINRRYWLQNFDVSNRFTLPDANPLASQTGYTIPGEYGGMEKRIQESFEPGSHTKIFVAQDSLCSLVGYAEIEYFEEEQQHLTPHEVAPDTQVADGEEVFSFPVTGAVQAQAQTAASGPHMELREIAVAPDNPGAAASLLRSLERYCVGMNVPDLFAYLIAHDSPLPEGYTGPNPGPNIPNKRSWNFLVRQGFTPVISIRDNPDIRVPQPEDSGLKFRGPKVAGLYKHLDTPSDVK